MTEVQVGQALSLPLHSKERKAMLQKLRNKCNYEHNTSVLEWRRGTQRMFVRKDLWRHVRRCPSKPEAASKEGGRTRVLGLATVAESAFSQQISQGVWKLLQLFKRVSAYNEERHCYQSPSLALKLGHSLKKVCEIIHCRALMSEDSRAVLRISIQRYIVMNS
ncbi:hypothetical protein Z043_123236 [Scleropages formosus]|uniref:Uncharacterized protein n=1 Tax=Scleropages formosus TaxID=113540 RepID=A0A0P7TMH0_SCLFO|nr:hypothetical protein Z043_123236 [Scleropages formosus]